MRRPDSALAQAARVAAVSLAIGAATVPVGAETGVTDDAILFGQSAAFSGPASALGTGMRDGIAAAFAEANGAGGVHGRELTLVSLDDRYEPADAIANAVDLIEGREVFALVGVVGTPTSRAVQPIASESGIPFIGAFTGADFLRAGDLDNVINVRASYQQETDAWIDYLVDRRGLEKIAILYQDDSFGRAGLAGVEAALAERGMSLAAEGTYMRNTTAVKRALLTIRKAEPDAVVIVGAYEPAAQFIRLAHAVGPDAVFMNISFVGSRALATELGSDGEGVLVTQVVPLPDDTTNPLVARYRQALRTHDPEAEFGFVSLEGYLVGRFIVEALERLGPAVSRAAFLDGIREAGGFDIDGVTLTFAPGDNQGLDQVFLTEIQSDGSFRTIDPASDGR